MFARLAAAWRIDVSLSPVLRLPEHWGGRELLNWKAAVAGGLLAGAAFLLVEMAAAVVVYGNTPWLPVRMMAGIAVGGDVVPPPGAVARFDIGIFAAAIYVHTVLSVTYAMFDGALLHRLRRMRWLAGGAVGLAIYLVNFYGFTVLFPWFVEMRSWTTALIHILFGIICATAYAHFETRPWARA